MKTRLLYSIILIFCSLIFTIKSYSQINYSQNFETDASEWAESYFIIIYPDFACTGFGLTFHFQGVLQPLSSVSGSIGISDGQEATLTYSYKVSDYYTYEGMPNDPDWGSIVVEYATSPDGPWTIVDTITPANHTVSSSCAVRTVNFTPSVGSNVYLRVTVSSVLFGDPDVDVATETAVALDNISVTQPTMGNSEFSTTSFKYEPNPVSDILSLSYDKNISTVEVYNIVGQKVIAKTINQSLARIDMSQLSAGTYMVKATSDTKTKTIKIVKQ